MQTVNFNCSHCRKMMAVGLNLLGRNVRCPHCKQVVQAPATPGPAAGSLAPVARQTQAPAPPPTFQPPTMPVEGQESIFGEVHDDNLFGTKQPKLQMPGELAPPPPPPVGRTHTEIVPQRSAPYASTNAPTIDLQSFPQPERDPWPTKEMNPSPHTEMIPESPPDEPEVEERPERDYAPRHVVRERGGGGGIFIWMLLFYAVVATGIAAYLFYDKTERETKQEAQGDGKEHPFLAIPDFFGQYDRAERKKAQKIEGMPAATLPVPPELRVRLTETKTIGDLEITPLKIDHRATNRYRRQAGRPDFFYRESPGKPFLLYLRLKNISENVYFHPTDPAFNRDPRSQPTGLPIYTGWVFGKEKQFILGGPFTWPDVDNEYIEGQQNDDKPLAPGEERDYVIASNFDSRPIRKALEDYEDAPIMWRVQLRRGLEKVKDPAGSEREISVSSVVGVVFDRTDIRY